MKRLKGINASKYEEYNGELDKYTIKDDFWINYRSDAYDPNAWASALVEDENGEQYLIWAPLERDPSRNWVADELLLRPEDEWEVQKL